MGLARRLSSQKLIFEKVNVYQCHPELWGAYVEDIPRQLIR